MGEILPSKVSEFGLKKALFLSTVEQGLPEATRMCPLYKWEEQLLFLSAELGFTFIRTVILLKQIEL